jgi:hypothetical protein
MGEIVERSSRVERKAHAHYTTCALRQQYNTEINQDEVRVNMEKYELYISKAHIDTQRALSIRTIRLR